jgi:predicted nucleic acid-binding protein
MLVVSDNSPLRYLRVLDCAHVLPVLFGRIIMPYAVLAELQHPKTPAVVRTWLADPPVWLEVRAIVGRPEVALSTLESGEQEAIVLAQELQADILLVDDGKARDVAIQQGLRVMGTVGVLEQAAARGLIDLPEVLTRLLTTNFRILRSIINDALARDTERKCSAGKNQYQG